MDADRRLAERLQREMEQEMAEERRVEAVRLARLAMDPMARRYFDEDEYNSEEDSDWNPAVGDAGGGWSLSALASSMFSFAGFGTRAGGAADGTPTHLQRHRPWTHGSGRGNVGFSAFSPGGGMGSYEQLLALDDHVSKKGVDKAQLAQRTFEQTLAKADVEKLPTKECVICLDEFKPRQKIRRLQCLCIFHTKCIDKYLKGATQCPICRQDV